MNVYLMSAAVAAALILAPAFAGPHGETGLWERQGVFTSNGQSVTFTNRFCRNAHIAEHPEAELGWTGGPCELHNLRWSGEQLDADIVCQGSMNGTGKVQYRFLSPEQYSMSASFKGSDGAGPLEILTEAEARFLSPDCGAVETATEK